MIPTFDEWFKRKYGMSFEAMHEQPGMHIPTSMKALSVAIREYVTEAIQTASEPTFR